MPLPPLIEEIARRFKEKLQTACGDRVLEVRLFGSMARGDFHEASDLDVFVMVDSRELALVDAISTAAWETGYEMELPFSISPLIMARDHFEELHRRERRIARDILTEGIAV